MYTVDILTLFPGSVMAVLGESIIKRAAQRGYVDVQAHQIRDFTENRQNQVDDYPYGGGRGCIMQAQPLRDAWAYAKERRGDKNLRTVYLSPCGKPFKEEDARRLARDYDGLILVCGHYEGVDQRFIDQCVDEEISLGDFVLTGGEIPAMAVADSVLRLIEGVLPSPECYENESHWDGLLEYPQYSRPETWQGQSVPDVLLGGNHAEIEAWRQRQSILRTKNRRPDMFERLSFDTKAQRRLLEGALRQEEDRLLTERIARYARLIIRKGINVQPGQTLVIRAQTESAEFARLCVREAYEAGAAEVIMRWQDTQISRCRYLHGAEAIFDEAKPWEADMLNTLAEKGAAFLSLSSEDPDALEGVDPDRLRRESAAFGPRVKTYRDRLNADKNQWCVAAIPNGPWAKKVFPTKPEPEAVRALWKAILKVTGVNGKDDPVETWDNHVALLSSRAEKLTEYGFAALHYVSSLGTDLTVELPENHVWEAASATAENGAVFLPNMPTEEIFTAPRRDGVNGVVFASKPLALSGGVAEGFSFRLEKGKIVEVRAKKGLELLEAELDVDENSRYLGEAALVPHSSPISKSGLLFYDTLFDENASCHLAFGSAYPNIRGGKEMSREELLSHGLNVSLQHCDFMIGTPDLSVTGITKAGEEVPIMVGGEFVI